MQSQLVQKLERAAGQRLTAARFLLGNDNLWLESMYIAGYGVEIALKALLLRMTPMRQQAEMFKGFRGAGWHDLLRLKKELAGRQCHLPARLARHFARVVTWSTAIRYEVGRKRYGEADLFLESAEVMYLWVKEQLR